MTSLGSTWLLQRLTINVPVGDSTACHGRMSFGSWIRLSSSPTASNCISWKWIVVTSRRADVTVSESGFNDGDLDSQRFIDVSIPHFGSHCLMSAPSDDTRQTHFVLSATYSWDVRSQATMSNGDLKPLTTIDVCQSLTRLSVEPRDCWTVATRQRHVTESHLLRLLQHTTRSHYHM